MLFHSCLNRGNLQRPRVHHDLFKLLEQLQSVDTTGIEPMSHPLVGSQRLRDDLASAPDNREAIMRNAPAQQDGLFLVPKVIE